MPPVTAQMADLPTRWLNPEAAASYVGRRVDELPRLVRRKLLPKPSYHFGPRSPRYDRLALDAMFGGEPASPSIEQIEQEAVAAIIRRAGARRARLKPDG
jgi:hypothetical protein